MSRSKGYRGASIFGSRGIVIALSHLVFLFAVVANEEDPASNVQVEQRIEELIGQLGADEYRLRERAEMQLAELGLVAFEALREAERDPDIEIKLRAASGTTNPPTVHWRRSPRPVAAAA